MGTGSNSNSSIQASPVGGYVSDAGGALMSTGVGIVPGAILEGIGQGINYFAGQNANAERERIMAQVANQQANLHSQAGAQVQNAATIAAQSPTTTSGQALASAGDFANAIKGAGATTGAPAVTGANARYGRVNAANATGGVGAAPAGGPSGSVPANTSVAQYAHELAPAMAQQQGATRSAQITQQGIANAASNVSALQSESYADQLVGQLASGTIAQNPGAGQIGGALYGIGKNLPNVIGGGSGAGIATPFDTFGAAGANAAGSTLATGGTDAGSAFSDAAGALA